MGIKSIPLIALLMVVATASLVFGQHYQEQRLRSGLSPAPQETALPAEPPEASQQGHLPPPPPAAYQAQPMPGDSTGMNYAEWPSYPYPPYHNPYYDGSYYARTFLTGTIDWICNLPSHVVGRFSNYMDRSFFPVTPATSGSASGSQVPGAPSTGTPWRLPTPPPPPQSPAASR